MRGHARLLVVVLGVVLLGFTTVAEAEDSWTLLPRGSEVRYRLVGVTPPAQLVGQIAARVAFQVGADATAVPAAMVVSPEGAPEARWFQTGLKGGQSGRMPIGVRDESGRCRSCATIAGNSLLARAGGLLVEGEFSLTAEQRKRVTSLDVVVRGHDGVAVWINGQEVARRNLSNQPLQPADALRGPEWETFHVSLAALELKQGVNRIALEARPSRFRDYLWLDLELRGFAGQRLLRGPLVQQVTDTSAVVMFSTQTPTRAAVSVKQFDRVRRVRSANGNLARNHRVVLTGLSERSAVDYTVEVAGREMAASRFFTPPSPQEPLRFAVYGDTRGGHATHEKIVTSLVREAPEFVVSTGDLVARGTDEGDWQRFFAVVGPMVQRIPFYPAAGNHDVGQSGDERRRLSEIFAAWPGPKGRPLWGNWHSFGVANVHFVMLDSNSYERPEQLAWLEADLLAARKRGVRTIFASTHDGPFSNGYHRGNETALQNYAPLLVKHDVAMLFSGHDHIYQRGMKAGLNYIVSGGGGAPLYTVRCGVTGKPACANDIGMQAGESAHHYIMVTVYANHAEVCPRRPDGTPLENCLRIPL